MDEVRVLELRIHGIANAPPAESLLADDEAIEQEDGDREGSFWRIKPGPVDADAVTPAARRQDPTVITEAYSWGNQARTGGSALALVGRAFVHVGWLLVLPFGLCNLAYWARRDIKGDAEDRSFWDGGDGATWIRVFALLQTLFYTIGLLTVSVHFIGMECFPEHADGAPAQVCAALPGWMEFLAGWPSNARAALLGLVPIAVILFVYVVGRRARAGFHPDTSFDQDAVTGVEQTARTSVQTSIGSPPKPPVLASLGFWRRPRTAEAAEWTHLAAVFAFVLVILACDALLDATGAEVRDVIFDPLRVAAAAPIPFWATVVGAVLLVSTFPLVAASVPKRRKSTRHEDRAKRRCAAIVLIASVVAFVGWLMWTLVIDRAAPAVPPNPAEAAGLSGLVVVPTTIAALGALIALASLSWGYARGYRLACSALIVGALACALVAATIVQPLTAQIVMASVAAGLVLLAVGASYLPLLSRRTRQRARVAGWRGNGAAVALLLAWFSSLVITSLLVLGSYAWLSADVDGGGEVVDHLRPVNDSLTAPIAPPVFYQRFGGMLVLILGVLIVAVVIAVITALRRHPAFSLPALLFPRDLDPEREAELRKRDRSLGGIDRLPAETYPTPEGQPTGRLRGVVDARRAAGLAHRGEPVMQLLAILTAAALIFLGIPTLGGLLPEVPGWREITAVSGWVLGLLALAAVAWVVTNALTSTERPLGLVWDIICFFPRAGHPFTPPCYAERAVPEVVKRVRHFIDSERKAGNHPYVILSAHSMGGTIAVAAIFALIEYETEHAEVEHRLDRVALLTHGSQLRAYFSRFFPEVFGARVLGIRGSVGPGLWRADPWTKEVRDEADEPRVDLGEPGDPATIVNLLGGKVTGAGDQRAPRWRNLWRRTDFLGFPVHGYWSGATTATGVENPIDRGATERCPNAYLWKIARHSDYLSTAQYREARQELVDEFVRALAVEQAPMAAPLEHFPVTP